MAYARAAQAGIGFLPGLLRFFGGIGKRSGKVVKGTVKALLDLVFL